MGLIRRMKKSAARVFRRTWGNFVRRTKRPVQRQRSQGRVRVVRGEPWEIVTTGKITLVRSTPFWLIRNEADPHHEAMTIFPLSRRMRVKAGFYTHKDVLLCSFRTKDPKLIHETLHLLFDPVTKKEFWKRRVGMIIGHTRNPAVMRIAKKLGATIRRPRKELIDLSGSWVRNYVDDYAYEKAPYREIIFETKPEE